jgi:hypothetical protein
MPCFFTVIADGQTATPICATAAFSPEQALKHYKGWSSEQAERYLQDGNQ